MRNSDWRYIAKNMTLTCCHDDIITENIWFVCSETSYSGDERRCNRCGTMDQPNSEDRATQPVEAWGWVSQYVHFEKLMNTQSFPLFSINHCWLFVYLDGRFPRPTFLGCSFPFLENVQTGECNLDPGFHSAPSTHQTWPAPSSASHLPRIVQVWPRGRESGKRDETCGIRVSLGEAQAVTT